MSARGACCRQIFQWPAPLTVPAHTDPLRVNDLVCFPTSTIVIVSAIDANLVRMIDIRDGEEHVIARTHSLWSRALVMKRPRFW